MNTYEYRTKTFFKNVDNRKSNNVWIVGLDVGYSGVKTFSGNSISCFPSYAVESASSVQIDIAGQNNNTILYRGEDGVLWDAGADAQNAISPSDTSAGSMAIFGRSRYYSPMFKVLMRIGIAAGLRTNQFGSPNGLPLFVQTGLPPKYILSDTEDLFDVMKGTHTFSVKFGGNGWEDFSFTLTKDNIGIMDQPEGTLFSISTDHNMSLIDDAKNYFSKRLLIIDPGFGTLDTFPMVNRKVAREDCQTFADLGMKKVMKDTADEIFKKYGFEVSVPAIQRYLESGEILKRSGRVYTKVPFGDILEEHSRDICNKAIEQIMDIYKPPVNFDYMVITGGTGAAWNNFIRENEIFKQSNTVKLISGNQGDPSLPYIVSNVRGYYIYVLSMFG